MIGSTRAIRVFARSRPTDLRNGFDGLYGIVCQEFGQDLLQGDFFLFVNKRRKSARVLHWDGTGLCIYSKRLVEGRFAKLWGADPGEPVELSRSELSLFLEGAQLAQKLSLSPPEYRH